MKDNNVYYKEGRKYIPFGVCSPKEWLGDGLWYCHHTNYSNATTNVKYIKNLFKICDIEPVDVSELCGLYKTADDIMNDKDFRNSLNSSNGYSIVDIVTSTLATLKKMSMEKMNKKK